MRYKYFPIKWGHDLLVLVAISLGALAIIDGAAGKIASKGIGLLKSRKS